MTDDGDPRDHFAATLEDALGRRAVARETLHAVAAGQLVDGVPVTSETIGALMHRYADVLAEQYGEGAP